MARVSGRFSRRSSSKEPAELDPEDAELRKGLQWQCTIVDAISAYVENVGAAFDTLSKAQKQLVEAGIDIRDWPSDPLLDRLREATGHMAEAAAATHGPLKSMRGALQSCFDDLSLADSAAMELKRYQQKVEALTTQKQARSASPEDTRSRSIFGNIFGGKSTDGMASSDDAEIDSPVLQAPPESSPLKRAPTFLSGIFAGSPSLKSPLNPQGVSDSSRMKRNMEKMHHWSDEFNLRQSRARDLLKACMSRHGDLVNHVRDIAQCVVKAVGITSGMRTVIKFEQIDQPREGPTVFSFSVTLPELPSTRQHRSPRRSFGSTFEVCGGYFMPANVPDTRSTSPESNPRRSLGSSFEASGGGAVPANVPDTRNDLPERNPRRSLGTELESYGEGVLGLQTVTKSSSVGGGHARGDSGCIAEDTSDVLLADMNVNGAPRVLRVSNSESEGTRQSAAAATQSCPPSFAESGGAVPEESGSRHLVDDFSIPEESGRARPSQVEVLSPFNKQTSSPLTAVDAVGRRGAGNVRYKVRSQGSQIFTVLLPISQPLAAKDVSNQEISPGVSGRRASHWEGMVLPESLSRHPARHWEGTVVPDSPQRAPMDALGSHSASI